MRYCTQFAEMIIIGIGHFYTIGSYLPNFAEMKMKQSLTAK